MKKIVDFLGRRWYVKWAIWLFLTGYPTYDFYLQKYESLELNISWSINWTAILDVLPHLFNGVLTGLLFLLFIRAQTEYYKVEETNKMLMRLNQLYKERFKMIKFGDTDKLMTSEFEKRLWRDRLYKKEPNNKKEIDAFIDDQYKFTHIDYDGRMIPIEK